MSDHTNVIRTPCPKGGGREELPRVRGQGHRQRVPDCDCSGMAEGSYTASEVRGGGQEELPQVLGQGRWLGRRILHSRPGVAARRSKPTSKEWWLWAEEGLEELFHVQRQKGRQ